MPAAESLCPGCKEKSSSFSRLKESELLQADKNKVQIRYRKGETIVKQGSFGNNILYVREGLVKVYKELEDDSDLIYGILPCGSLLGLSNLYSNNIFKYTAAAMTDSNICSVDKNIIERFIRDNGDFAMSIIELLNQETSMLRDKMVSLTHKHMKGRLSDTLIHLSKEIFNSTTFPYKLSRNDLAEFSGMSMMSVVRTMQEFLKSGYVREKDGKIEILEMDALESISKGD